MLFLTHIQWNHPFDRAMPPDILQLVNDACDRCFGTPRRLSWWCVSDWQDSHNFLSLHSRILLVHILGVNELVAKRKWWNKHRVIPHRSMCSARRCNVLYLYWPFSYQRVCAAEAAHLQERFSWPETFALGNFHTLKCMEFVNWHGMLYTTIQSCGK